LKTARLTFSVPILLTNFLCVLISHAQNIDEQIVLPSRDASIHDFRVRMEPTEIRIWNPADNISVWNYTSEWHEKMEQQPDDYFQTNFPFVRYVQLMTAAGGNEQRDLFKNPEDRSITDDYDFSPLIRACRNILRQGLIPHLKLGNVPLKYSTTPEISEDFGVNIRPPYDYNLWHAYIKAMMEALVKEFGKKEVQQWRFGLVTEYENKSWFSVGGDPEKTRDAYLTLYDYTIDALEEVLGQNICVGAHSMTVSEGLWDERALITHCARGRNRCTGEKGTRLSFLAASYYDERPGRSVKGSLSFLETIDHLREFAKREGFNHLFFGIDEGRILSGLDGKPLSPRAVGHTWQAAYDARLYRMMLDGQVNYFSHWAYTTHGILPGVPSVSAQASTFFHQLSGSFRLPLEQLSAPVEGEEIGAIAGWDQAGKKLYLLFYAYSDSLHRRATREIACKVSGIKANSHSVPAERRLISDDSNFFDEWVAEQSRLGITADDFGWSSDSFVILPPTLKDVKHVALFDSQVSYYRSRADIRSVPEQLVVNGGDIAIYTEIPLHGVLLYEVSLD